MTNFDSLLLAHPSTLELTTGQLGSWRQTALGTVLVVADRSLVSASKIRLPGQTGGKRGETAAEFAKVLSERKQITNHLVSLSPTASYLRKTRGVKVAEEYLRDLRKGDP
jgi:hypothetical protein